MARVTYDTKDFIKGLREEVSGSRVFGAVLERVGARTVELLQSYVGMNEEGRRTHPGGWADRRGDMVEGYGFEVDQTSGGWALTVYNTDKQAHLVEALEGLFVIRGIMDKGGPVSKALKQAFQELAPEWKWTD